LYRSGFRFAPSTNILPVRRHPLNAGEKIDINAAWIRFPYPDIYHLKQSYERISRNERIYSTEKFTAKLQLNENGFITKYGETW
jgi:hypothetical protein